eukprot:SAG31_NODE_1036_length_10221_cov_170.602326_3_plen_164_part_00
MHRASRQVLPHIFIAASNLSVNHAPNQKAAFRGGIINVCIEICKIQIESENVAYAGLNCLHSLTGGRLDGQASNHNRFLSCGGMELLTELAEEHDKQNVTGLIKSIRDSIEDGRKEALMQMQGQLGGNLSLLEQEELGNGDPYLFCEDDARTVVIRQNELRCA